MKAIACQDLSEKQIDTHTVIIGSGPSGLTLASALSGDLIVVESGGHGIDMQFKRAHRSHVSGEPTKPDSVRVRAIGGATTRWTGRCAELDDWDFEERPWMAERGWPIQKDVLAPYYEKIWDLLGLATCSKYGHPREHSANEAELLASHLRMQRWSFWGGSHKTKMNIIGLFPGLFDGEKKRLVYAAEAVQIITDGSRAVAVRVVDRSGASRLIRAKRFILAAGCVDNIKILLLLQSQAPEFTSQVEKWLGRGFMQHLRVSAGQLLYAAGNHCTFHRQFGLFKGKREGRYELGLSIQPEYARQQKIGNASLFFLPEGQAGVLAKLARGASRLIGRPPPDFAQRTIVMADVEQEVLPESRVTLHRDLGPHGVPRADIDWRISKRDYRTTCETLAMFEDYLERAGLGTLCRRPGLGKSQIEPELILDSNHPLGGTRMAADASHGVVDRNCKVFGTQNLWAVGGSVFATGGHANPTITMMALARRLADHLENKSNK